MGADESLCDFCGHPLIDHTYDGCEWHGRDCRCDTGHAGATDCCCSCPYTATHSRILGAVMGRRAPQEVFDLLTGEEKKPSLLKRIWKKVW